MPRQDFPSNKAPQFNVRMPPDLKAWIERESARNGCSQNSEIIRAIRNRKEHVEATR